MKIILGIVLGLILIVFLVGWWRTYKTQHSANAKRFLAGTVPNPLPEGFYKGQVLGYHGGWQGKQFDASQKSGINVFLDNGQRHERYPFATYTDTGLRDRQTDVLKIDYSQSPNPWYAKMVLDEVVQTAPNQYLGKIHLRVLPGISFAIGYFTLEK